MAWAFATACQLDARLFALISRVVEERVNDFHPQELTNAAWAFATMGQSDAQLIRAARAGEIGAQHFANTAFRATQCHGDSGQRMRILFCALARVAERRLVEFTAQGLANAAWAFTKAG